MLAALFLALLANSAQSASIFDSASTGKCQPIEIELCKNTPYNYTYFPNSINHDQQSLQSQAEHFKPLIKTKCNPHIHFFVCSVFAPMCPPDLPQEVRSCRSVCEQVKRDCLSILEEFGIVWPDVLECSQFRETPDLCMKPEKTPRQHHDSRGSLMLRPHSLSSCPTDLLDVDMTDPNGVCAYKCGADVMFSHQDKAAARSWMILWGSIDFMVSLFTFLTFLIDRRRFRYPQRCVCYLSLCYLMFSIPHLFPLFLQYAARACDRLVTGQSYLVFSGFENTNCLLSFVLTYYFGTASALWWLMFAFTWYLSAGRKWVPEGVDACSSYLHFVAWGLSGILTIAVLVMHKVDASELSGICGVGYSHPQALLMFSLVPRTILVVVGSCFVLAGFASMCRERDSFRQRGTDTSKLEKLMVKMGMFCLLYIVPAVTVIVCDSYHFLTMQQWYPTTLACKRSTVQTAMQCRRPPLPQSEIYLLGLMMSLAGGIACAMWVTSSKSFQSWQRLLCCGLCGAAPQKTPAPASRPLLEPPTAPPPQPPASHYLPMSTHSHNVWRPSKVV